MGWPFLFIFIRVRICHTREDGYPGVYLCYYLLLTGYYILLIKNAGFPPARE